MNTSQLILVAILLSSVLVVMYFSSLQDTNKTSCNHPEYSTVPARRNLNNTAINIAPSTGPYHVPGPQIVQNFTPNGVQYKYNDAVVRNTAQPSKYLHQPMRSTRQRYFINDGPQGQTLVKISSNEPKKDHLIDAFGVENYRYSLLNDTNLDKVKLNYNNGIDNPYRRGINMTVRSLKNGSHPDMKYIQSKSSHF